MLQNFDLGPCNEVKSGPFFIPRLNKYQKYIIVEQTSPEMNYWLLKKCNQMLRFST